MKLKPLHNKITVRLTEGRGAWRNFLSNAEGEDTDPYRSEERRVGKECS